MHAGSCLCGGIRYELDAELTEIVCCHCQACRKAQGTAFATNAPIPADRLKFVSGKDLLSAFESSPGKHRVFCRNCGSPIFSRAEQLPGVVRLRIGTLDTPVRRHAPDYHIYTASKAEWHDILDTAPQHAERRK